MFCLHLNVRTALPRIRTRLSRISLRDLLIYLGFGGYGGFTIRFNSKIDFLRGRNGAPVPAELFDLNGDQLEISHSPLYFLLLGASARTMRDEASVVPSGTLVVPSTTLLLLTSVERTIVVMIAIA